MATPHIDDAALSALGRASLHEAEARRSLDLSKVRTHDIEHEKEPIDEEAETGVPVLASGKEKSVSRPDDYPTEEELATLKRVPGMLDYKSLLLAIIELSERFSYYGCVVVFTNYLQQPLPPNSSTGSSPIQPGALGLGQQKEFGLTTFNSFWVYCCPLFGGYVADVYWGRFKTICVAVVLALFGHVLLTISAIPSVLKNPNGSLACFVIAIIVMGIGTGAFKSNISPLVAEQSKNQTYQVKTNKAGERVIVDPNLTTARLYMWFYLFINIGALVGQISMVYAEKRVGFWLAFLLPTLVFTMAPIILWAARNRYVKSPPEGSVIGLACKLWAFAAKRQAGSGLATTIKRLGSEDFWEDAKPSAVEARGQSKPSWMTFDDVWVDEVRRGFKACTVFLFFPFYWLAYNQLTNNLTSQAAVMNTHGLPNDLLNNLDPLALLILIPILDLFVYPAMRKAGFRLSPIQRMFWGFMTGTLAMICAAVIQHYIYKTSPCGNHASTCTDANGNALTSPLNVWIQTPAYVLIAISEICASVTGLEYAFTKAPENCRSMVMAIFFFMSAISSALGEAFTSASQDPNLVWNYGSVGVISFIGGIFFWISFRHLDKEEEALNRIAEAKYK